MIVGSGLFARGFANFFEFRNDTCIFSSGVSNSNCKDPKEFDREKKLLSNYLGKYKNIENFIYFSTCSAFNSKFSDSPYIHHKIKMESIVLNHPSSIIFRLPQVVGPGGNPFNLINYIYMKINLNQKFEVWKRATRNIIDIDDVVLLCNYIINSVYPKKRIYNIANISNYSIFEIISSIEKILNKKALYSVIDKGEKTIIDVTEIYPIIIKLKLFTDNNYLYNLLKKKLI